MAILRLDREDICSSGIMQLYLLCPQGGLMETDPVCKMKVDPKTAIWKSEYKNKTYYFCAPGCKHTFDKDPETYASGKGPLIKM
jgi:YHS domain-containing protein